MYLMSTPPSTPSYSFKFPLTSHSLSCFEGRASFTSWDPQGARKRSKPGCCTGAWAAQPEWPPPLLPGCDQPPPGGCPPAPRQKTKQNKVTSCTLHTCLLAKAKLYLAHTFTGQNQSYILHACFQARPMSHLARMFTGQRKALSCAHVHRSVRS